MFFYGKMMFKVDVIYKICSKDEWRIALEKGVYSGSSDDLRDGFIHFSAFDQVTKTLDKHFTGLKGLLLLKVSTEHLAPSVLKWEVSRNNEKFPHLYGDLDLDAVLSVDELPDHDEPEE
tara:strand:+ start:178951 stop:179307 length:357 start_codon:yes stop_codon:yes gene_type:complete